jgi:hypothetical protein
MPTITITFDADHSDEFVVALKSQANFNKVFARATEATPHLKKDYEERAAVLETAIEDIKRQEPEA